MPWSSFVSEFSKQSLDPYLLTFCAFHCIAFGIKKYLSSRKSQYISSSPHSENAFRFQVQKLYLAPIKSFPQISVNKIEFDEDGPKFDRIFELIDSENRYISLSNELRTKITQQIQLSFNNDQTGIIVSIPKENKSIEIPFQNLHSPTLSNIVVYTGGQKVDKVADAGDEVAEFFSQILDRKCRLIQALKEYGLREVDPQHQIEGLPNTFAFANRSPWLLCNQSSMDDLNCAIKKKKDHTNCEPLEIERFRANVIVAPTAKQTTSFLHRILYIFFHFSPQTLAASWAEDRWSEIFLGNHRFILSQPAPRCPITTFHSLSGEKNPQNEPIQTLQEIRKGDNSKKFFGTHFQNADAKGVIHVGDQLIVKETRSQPHFLVSPIYQ